MGIFRITKSHLVLLAVVNLSGLVALTIITRWFEFKSLSGNGSRLFERFRQKEMHIDIVKKYQEKVPGYSFTKSLEDFPWENFKTVALANNGSAIQYFSELLIEKIIPFLILEPLTPVNESCKAPKVVSKTELKCSKVYNATRKVGILFQLGFDVDVLEIHLNELNELVDKFFILESTRAHYKMMRKPLLWDSVKAQPRFKKFQGKIVHFVVDDADLAAEEKRLEALNKKREKISNLRALIFGTKEERLRWNAFMKLNEAEKRYDSEVMLELKLALELDRSTGEEYVNEFILENLQERLRWEKFLQWNNATKYFNDYDILGFGDVDEIPKRVHLNYLKHCTMADTPLDVGIWFPFGAIDQAFASDFPVPKHPFTLGDPTFWTLKRAMEQKLFSYPTRSRGRAKAFLLGGMHMSNYGYLPYQLVKRITMNEQDRESKQNVHLAQFYDELMELRNKSMGTSFTDIEDKYGAVPARYRNNVFKLAQLNRTKMEEIVYFPWFYDCNRERYPSWERKHDSRLD